MSERRMTPTCEHKWYYYDLDHNPFPGICMLCGVLKEDSMDDLRRLAEAAPPGPWFYTGDVESGGVTIASDPYWEIRDAQNLRSWESTGKYIAACSPDRILALLDQREALRAAADAVYMGKIGFNNPHDPDILALGAALGRRPALKEQPR